MFSDKPVLKRRPAAVISSAEYHASRQEVIVAAITSNVREPPFVGDHVLSDWRASGLPKPSVVTGIVRTLKQAMIVRTLGALTEPDRRAVDGALSRALDL